MRNDRARRIAAVVLIAALALTGCAGAKPDGPSTDNRKPQKVRLAYLRIGSDLPYFVGVSKGIFSKHGLEIDGQRIADSNLAMQAVIDGQVDATDIIGSAVVFQEAVKRPGTFNVYSASAAGPNSNIHQLIARKGSGVSAIRHLAGKRLAVFPGTQMRVYVQLVLDRELGAARAAKVELVPLPPPQQVQAMRDGQVDAVLALEPTGTELVVGSLGDRIASNVLYEYVSKPMPFVTAFGVIRTDWAAQNPSSAEALVAAYREIMTLIAQRPDEARAVLVSDLGVDPAVARQVSLYEYTVVPGLPTAALEASAKLMVEKGVLERAPELRQFLFSPK